MSIYNQKAFRGIFNRLKNNKGISLIAVIIVMLLVATLSLVVASTVTSANISSVTDMQTQQAFYIAQAGVEWYIEQLENDNDWSTPPAVKTDESFGVGTFSVTYANEEETSIDVTGTGEVTGWDGNTVQRAITQHIENSGGGGSLFSDFAIFYGGGDGTISTTVARNQTITGDTFIHGDLSISSNCTITGDVLATGDISVHGTTNVSGDVIEHINPAPATQPTLETTYYDNLIAAASEEEEGNVDFEGEEIDGIIYVNGDVWIDDYLSGSGIIVATGDIEINRWTDVGLDGGSDITLIAGGSLTMGVDGNVGINETFYSSSNMELYQGTVLGAGAGEGEGVILLSPGDISLAQNITMTGLVFGDDVAVARNLDLTGTLSGNRLTNLAQGAVITQDDTKVDYGSIEGFDSGGEIIIQTSLWRESL